MANHGRAELDKVQDEFGDLLFTAINLGRHLKLDAESALRSANGKFRNRFRAMEAAAGGYDALAALTPTALDVLWNRAKCADGVVFESDGDGYPDLAEPDGREL